MSQTVQLYVYDLSNGLAKQLGQAFIGKQIEGIWHTGVVVYGKEYFYQGGITNSSPGKSMAGTPLKVIEMGETEIPYELFLEFLNDINAEYTEEKYNIISHNCNNFSNEVCEFLVGKKIPDWITGLPNEILSTPLGQMLLPSLQAMTNIPQSIPTFNPSGLQGTSIPQTSNQNNPQPPVSTNPIPQSTSSIQSHPSKSFKTNTGKESKVIELKSLSQLDKIVNENAAVISMFISPNIEACISITPIYEEKALKNTSKQIKFCCMNLLNCVQAKLKYGINIVPYFFLFYKGQEFSTFQGANQERLTNDIDSLIELVKSEHEHTFISFLSFKPNITDFLIFDSNSNSDKMLKEIGTILQKMNDKFPALKRIVEEKRTIINSEQELSEINQIINNLDLTDLVGLLDLLRQSLFDISKNKDFAVKFFSDLWTTLIQKVYKSEFKVTNKKLGFALRLILRCLCNLSKIWDQLINQKELIEVIEKVITIDDISIIDASIKLISNLVIKASPEFLSILRNRLTKNIILKLDFLKSNENELNCALHCLCKLFYLMEPTQIKEIVKDTSLEIKLNQISISQVTKNNIEDCKRMIDI